MAPNKNNPKRASNIVPKGNAEEANTKDNGIVERARSPIWKGASVEYDHENFMGTVKEKNLKKDDLTMESHKAICNLIVETSQKTSSDISNSFQKVERELDAIRDVCTRNNQHSEETALQLHYEKVKYENCVILYNCPESDLAKEVLSHVTEEDPGNMELLKKYCWSIGLNNQHTAVRLNPRFYRKVIQMKNFKLANHDKYSAINLRPFKGPIEMRITRNILDKASELNQQANPEFNGKPYDTTEGKFGVVDGGIKFFKNKN